jgi:hypothetical protein
MLVAKCNNILMFDIHLCELWQVKELITVQEAWGIELHCKSKSSTVPVVFRRIEEDVRNLNVKSKWKHPEVCEAAERALMTLKTMGGVLVIVMVQ